MQRRFTPSLVLTCGILVAGLTLTSSAGPVAGLTTFRPGDVADANDVNANFAAVQSAVNDNDARIAQLETSAATRSVHVPARGLAYLPSDTGITPDSLGLVVARTSGFLRVYCRKPSDYRGGDALVTVIFQPRSNTPGVVDFALEHLGNDCGTSRFLNVSANAAGVAVSDQERLYCQKFVIPAAGLDYDVWSFYIDRGDSDSTYLDDVRVLSVDWQYAALPPSP